METTPRPAKTQITILVVDDDPLVRQLVFSVLQHGDEYNVLLASSGAEALRQSKDFRNEIQVLISDFQMSEMSGIELATAMTVDRPKLKVLMMSGFPEGMLVLNEGWHFLPKPFVSSQLRTLIVGLVAPDKKSRFAGSVVAAQRGPQE